MSPAEIVPLPVEWLVNVQTRLMFFVGWLFFLVGGRHVVPGPRACPGYALVTRCAAFGRIRRSSCDVVKCAARDSNMRVIPRRRAHLLLPMYTSYACSSRVNSRSDAASAESVTMFRGLCIPTCHIWRRPGMTEPRFADESQNDWFHRIDTHAFMQNIDTEIGFERNRIPICRLYFRRLRA
jgi:hypothetical protein